MARLPERRPRARFHLVSLRHSPPAHNAARRAAFALATVVALIVQAATLKLARAA
ncbi:MAG: hypothetical protein ACLPSW_00530 [Roseiarcus sp.]